MLRRKWFFLRTKADTKSYGARKSSTQPRALNQSNPGSTRVRNQMHQVPRTLRVEVSACITTLQDTHTLCVETRDRPKKHVDSCSVKTYLGAEPQGAEDLRHEHDVRQPVYGGQDARLLELDVVHRQLGFLELRPLPALHRGGVGRHAAELSWQNRDGIAGARSNVGEQRRPTSCCEESSAPPCRSEHHLHAIRCAH